jgi:hypothetical protein
MKILTLFIPFSLAFGLFTTVMHAEEHDGASRFDQELDEADFRAVRRFVDSKRDITLQEKSCNLTISGDVRTQYRYIQERQNGENLRGGNAVYVFYEIEDQNDEIYTVGERLPISRNEFDVMFNLRIDYVNDCTWAVAHVRFDESMGVDSNNIDCSIDPEGYKGSGSCDNLCLHQAYMGYNIYACGDSRLDIELGRRGNLYYVFDSQIQFLSRLDGVLLTYSDFNDCIGNWYFKVAGFVVDERVNQLAWATELGFINICESGVDFKYSFIDWVKRGENRCFAQNPIGFKFRNSQFTVAYHFNPDFLNAPSVAYAAYLINHTPSEYTFVNGVKEFIGRKNIGWYAGFRVGEVYEEGDWSVDIMYAVVEKQAMPDNDVRSIGTGNVLHESFTAQGRGNTNWRGWQFAGLYAFTNNLALNTLFQYSRVIDKKDAGNHHYSNVKVEAIYAF